MNKSKLMVAIVAGVVFSLPAAAKMYKWVDDKGVTHYGETIPPEYAHKDRTVLNKDGRVEKKVEVLTAEERRAREQAESQKRADEDAQREQKRRDKALRNTYASEKEIDLARDRNLQQVEARINSASSQLKILGDDLQGLQKEADGYTGAGKKVPDSLRQDLNRTLARRDKIQKDLEGYKAEKIAVESRYSGEKARFKELTGR
ncbi:MAG: DUF4124 domain-containing protein [Gallionella sp.]|nr:DUF4124 domain-containing protein [Gallionella sp.]